MRALLFAALLAPLATSLPACCGAGCPPRSTQGAEGGPMSSSSATPSSSSHAGLAPRMDLHCTPQSTDGEPACLAQGKDRHYGAPLTCRGTPPPPEEVAAEKEAWEKGTSPCVCYTDADIDACSKVP